MEAHAASVVHPSGTEILATARVDERRVAWLYVCTGLTVFGAMGLAGIAMRLNQAEVITLSDSWFYRLLTLHNLTFYLGLMRQMREAIARGDFSRFRARFLARYGLESLRGSADDTPADSEA